MFLCPITCSDVQRERLEKDFFFENVNESLLRDEDSDLDIWSMSQALYICALVGQKSYFV